MSIGNRPALEMELEQLYVVQGPEACHITQPLVPIVEVAYRGGQWWTIAPGVSQMLLQKMRNGENAVYTYDWGPNGREGTWRHEGQKTTINRYMIDFKTMTQMNIDNQSERSIRIAYIRPQDVEALLMGGASAR